LRHALESLRDASDDAEQNQEIVQVALIGLMDLMVPTSLRGNQKAPPAAPTPAPAKPSRRNATSLSKKRTSRSSRTRARAG
jgi:hypothetical protein